MLGELVYQGFIPENTAQKLWKTEPGKMAQIIGQLLYDMAEELDDKYTPPLVKLRVGGKIFLNSEYHDVQKSLRDIEIYLEKCALREVLK